MVKNKTQIFSVILSVLVSVFLVTVFVYGATTIGANITTTGTADVGSVTTTDALYVGGTASTTNNLYVGMGTAGGDDIIYFDANEGLKSLTWDESELRFAFSNHVYITGGATTTDTLSIGQGSEIRKFSFGTCDFPNTNVTASSTGHIWCLNATNVTSADTIYVTATSSLDTNFVIQAASSTSEANDKISLRVLNLGLIEDGTLNGASLNWQSIR